MCDDFGIWYEGASIKTAARGRIKIAADKFENKLQIFNKAECNQFKFELYNLFLQQFIHQLKLIKQIIFVDASSHSSAVRNC